MHPLITIDELDKLTDRNCSISRLALRDLILTHDLGDADLRRCLITLSNAVYVRQLRLRGRSVTINPP